MREQDNKRPYNGAEAIEGAAQSWRVRAVEDLMSGDFIEFAPDEGGRLSCKKALKLEAITAIAARNILKGETVIFNTTDDTVDLERLREPN
jgi:hypothetical protein